MNRTIREVDRTIGEDETEVTIRIEAEVTDTETVMTETEETNEKDTRETTAEREEYRETMRANKVIGKEVHHHRAEAAYRRTLKT